MEVASIFGDDDETPASGVDQLSPSTMLTLLPFLPSDILRHRAFPCALRHALLAPTYLESCMFYLYRSRNGESLILCVDASSPPDVEASRCRARHLSSCPGNILDMTTTDKTSYPLMPLNTAFANLFDVQPLRGPVCSTSRGAWPVRRIYEQRSRGFSLLFSLLCAQGTGLQGD